jgi:hypothetical protein
LIECNKENYWRTDQNMSGEFKFSFVSFSPYEKQTDLICFLQKDSSYPNKKNSVKIACMGIGDLEGSRVLMLFFLKSLKNGAKNTLICKCATFFDTQTKKICTSRPVSIRMFCIVLRTSSGYVSQQY